MAPKKPERKDIFYICIILILVIALASILLQNTLTASSQKYVLDRMEGVYRMLTESDVEVVSVRDEGYVYKILIRLKLKTGDVIKELYATKDGKFFSENVMDVSDTMKRLEREKDFAECLRAKGFLIFGQKNEPNTLQQLLAIGNYANKVYVDCVGANLQACQQLGIKTIPTIVYNRMNYTGVKTRQWIETLTGCKY